MLKALTYEEYIELHPNEKGGMAELANIKDKYSHELNVMFPGLVYIRSGFLSFTHETAKSWGVPFEGDYALFVLKDWTKAKYV